MDCQRHNRVSVSYCPECEMEQDELNAMAMDDFDRMPFGDAMRWEADQCAADDAAERYAEAQEAVETRDFECDFPYPEESISEE